MPKVQNICVIGGGFSGLTSALILAKNGSKVTLVEKAPQLGMTGRGFSRQGVYFDTGLHYTGGLGENGIVSRYLRYLGIPIPDLAPFLADGFDEIRFADTGQRIRLPIGDAAMGEALKRHFPDEKDAVDTYLQAAREDFDSSSLLNFFFHTQGQQQPRSNTALADYLRDLTGNAHLRAALAIHCLLYGVSPEEVPFTQHAYVTASYFDSVHNFAGGGHSLIKAMEKRLDELGVRVILGNGVRRLVCANPKRLNEVELENGERLATDAAICTVHPHVLADMGTDIFRPAYLDHLRSLGETTSAFMLFGIAEPEPECLRGRNLFLCRDANLSTAFVQGTRPETGPFFVAASPQPAGSRKSGIVVVAPGFFEDMAPWRDSVRGKRPESYTAFKASVTRRVAEAISELCPELADVRFVDAATPLTMRDFLQSPLGGLYGCKHTVHQFNPMPVTRVANLLLAGQAIIAPGLMGAMISAFLACGFLLGHETLLKEAACS